MQSQHLLVRTTPGSLESFQLLDDVLSTCFLPAVTGKPAFGPLERELLSLPAHLGGLGIIIPTTHFLSSFPTSQRITAPLVDQLLKQCLTCSLDVYLRMYQFKREARAARHDALCALAKSFSDCLSPSLKRVFEAASERGASGWLTTLPIADHGFAMPKGEFRDALCLRFGWQIPNLPQSCVCGRTFSVQHAFSCPCGGFPSIRHNELRI